MGINIINGDKANSKYLKDCLLLDFESYDNDQHLEYDLVNSLYKKNPNIYVMAIDCETNCAIGYINFAPVVDKFYEKIKSGAIYDSEISADDILEYKNNNVYSCYFCSVVVNSEYRNKGIANMMVNNLKNYLIMLHNKYNIEIKRIVADVLTEGGEHIVKKFGLQYVKDSKHGSRIFEFVS